MESHRFLWAPSIKDGMFPQYTITTDNYEWDLPVRHKPDDIYDISEEGYIKGVYYDIDRISSRNARKNELGPYKNSFLREIITSHSMGKASGTKQELVSTILSFHEAKSR